MKKIFLLAASVALVFASCVKTTTVGPDAETLVPVTVKISGAGAATRSIDTIVEGTDEAGDEIGTIELTNLVAYVFDASGEYVDYEPLNTTTATSTDGQQLTNQYPITSTIYVVANIRGASPIAVFGNEPSLAEVKAATEDIEDLTVDFQDAPLANANGEAAQITAESTLFVANVEIAPVISRLELVAIDTKADSKGGLVTKFDVTGVYVDSTYPSFNYEGFGAGTETYQSTSDDFSTIAAYFKNEATWSSGTTDPATVSPSATTIWGYNVAPSAATATTSGKAVNRLIIRVANVMYDEDAAGGNPAVPYPGVHFLTVNNYSGVTAFERGKIYRVGSDATGAGKFEFSKDDLDPMPNPPTGNVLVNVEVTVKQWVLVTPGAVLM